ncbi:MAG TPA: ABC transporter substrate-binding protein [Clostridiales bacterium]|nr:ABC transporter substrate-binding protein [Clostridiales bacterium]
MKKIISAIAVLSLLTLVLTGCKAEDETKEILVGASITPHAEILEQVKPILEKAGYKLTVKEYTDYVQPNLALDSGDLDANFFQHQPYLDGFNEERHTKLVSIAKVHYEPFGIYPGKTKSLDELAEGALITVPNDTTNEARALLLLEQEGLIKLKEDAGLKATINDIIENPKNLDILEVEAAQLAISLQDVDMAVINGNFAIQEGLKPTDALAVEDEQSLGSETFGNVIVIRVGDEDREDLKALVDAIMSDEIRDYINDTYQGAVVPLY